MTHLHPWYFSETSVYFACNTATQKMLLYVQGCKKETDPISTVYALGVNAAPTRQTRACFVEHTISAMDLTCSSGHLAKVDLARC